MRRAAKTDDNHAEILKAYRELGCSVYSTHMVGEGFPDCVVGCAGITDLVEIKDGEKIPSKRKLTKDEEEFFAAWVGAARVVESRDDVVIHVQDMRHRGIILARGLRFG